MADETKRNINVLQRAFQLVERLSGDSGGKRIVQLAQETGLPPSTTHRILKTLMQAGFVHQESATGHYRLTGKLMDLGSRAVVGRDLRSEAAPLLRRLRELTGESSHLVVLDRLEALTVDSVLSEERNLVDSRVGERVPLHSTAVGKCLIAWRPDVDDLVSSLEMPRFTRNTICTAAGLCRELDRVREQGYAIDWEENDIGIRCVAAPVRDSTNELVACVGISGPATRVTDDKRDEIARQVLDVARTVSRALGFEPDGK